MYKKSLFLVGLVALFAAACGQADFKWTKTPSIDMIPNKPVTGSLHGQAFKATYVQLKEKAGKTHIYLAAARPEKPCKRLNFFVKNAQIVLRFPSVLKPGVYTNALSDRKNGSIYWVTDKSAQKTSSSWVSIAYALKIDSISEGRANGSIAVCVGDKEKSYAVGTFSAEHCTSRVKQVEKPYALNGVTWSMDKYTADQIPDAPLKGKFLGADYDVRHVVLRKKSEGYSLVFMNKKPDKACGSLGSVDEFKIDSKLVLKPGTYVHTSREKNKMKSDGKTGGATAWHVWFSYPMAYDGGIMSNNPLWNLALVISDVDLEKKQVKGKLIVACNDASKTMLAGAFTAVYCASQ